MIELPSSLRVWAALMAFKVIFLTCLPKLSWASSHIPRYHMTLAGWVVFISLGLFVGMVAAGLMPACLPLMDLVK